MILLIQTYDFKVPTSESECYEIIFYALWYCGLARLCTVTMLQSTTDTSKLSFSLLCSCLGFLQKWGDGKDKRPRLTSEQQEAYNILMASGFLFSHLSLSTSFSCAHVADHTYPRHTQRPRGHLLTYCNKWAQWQFHFTAFPAPQLCLFYLWRYLCVVVWAAV